MGRVQLRKTNKIKQLRKKNFGYLYRELSKIDQLVMPKWNEDADVCCFPFPFNVKCDIRGKLVEHLKRKE